jgi:hypothetical protein
MSTETESNLHLRMPRQKQNRKEAMTMTKGYQKIKKQAEDENKPQIKSGTKTACNCKPPPRKKEWENHYQGRGQIECVKNQKGEQAGFS